MGDEAGRHLLGGEWREGDGDELTSRNPANGHVVWHGAAASPQLVDEAVSAANTAALDWRLRPVADRQAVLEEFVAVLERRGDELATAITNEVGKPVWEGKTEVGSVRGKQKATVAAYEQYIVPSAVPAGAAEAGTFFRPLGTVVVLGPFNFPAHMPNGHIMPALLAGNAVVFKPSDLTPLVATVYASIWEEAGLPAGVLNVVHGQVETGRALIEHDRIDGVFFNGSRASGVAISKSLAGQPEKLLVLEMGGNNALVVWDYADLRAAVHLALQSCYVTSGQRCTAARRLIIPNSDEAFLPALRAAVAAIKVGAPDSEPNPFMGPVVSTAAAERLLAQQDALLDLGGRQVITMQPTEHGLPFLRPGLIDLTDVTNPPDDEIFGPLLQVFRVPDINRAIDTVNASRTGLSAGIVTQDEKLFEDFRLRTRTGIVNWNQQLTGASGLAPFGGIGESGNHRPSGFTAALYCSDAVGGLHTPVIHLPETLTPGLSV